MRREDILEAIWRERDRQDAWRAQGRWPRAPAWENISPCGKMAILAEEVGEVAQAAQDLEGLSEDGGDLQNELVQCAAVICHWLETL